jgi:hypothetical protein
MFPRHNSGQQDRSLRGPQLDTISESVSKLANFQDAAVLRKKGGLSRAKLKGFAPQSARADNETHSLASLNKDTVLLCMLYEVSL